MRLNKSHVFVLFFMLFAFLATYITFTKIPHSLVVHINDEWHLLLVGETNTAHLEYHGADFVSTASNTANLWLTGHGFIKWQAQQIEVTPTGIHINDKIISKSNSNSEAHLMLYPYGRISKGKFESHD